MPKLPVLNADKIIKFLKRRGFVLDRTKVSHKIYFNPETKRRVVIPYHKRDIPKGTLISILKQAGFNKKDLLEKE